MDPSEILWLPIAYLAVLIGHRQRNPHTDAFQRNHSSSQDEGH
jgi:hypothetical protein